MAEFMDVAAVDGGGGPETDDEDEVESDDEEEEDDVSTDSSQLSQESRERRKRRRAPEEEEDGARGSQRPRWAPPLSGGDPDGRVHKYEEMLAQLAGGGDIEQWDMCVSDLMAEWQPAEGRPVAAVVEDAFGVSLSAVSGEVPSVEMITRRHRKWQGFLVLAQQAAKDVSASEMRRAVQARAEAEEAEAEAAGGGGAEASQRSAWHFEHAERLDVHADALERLTNLLYSAYQLAISAQEMAVIGAGGQPPTTANSLLSRQMPAEFGGKKGPTKFNVALQVCLERMHQHGYRCNYSSAAPERSCVYSPVVLRNGCRTVSYVPMETPDGQPTTVMRVISGFINGTSQLDPIFAVASQHGKLAAAVANMSMSDARFPEYFPDRHVHGFVNGYLNVKDDVFHDYSDGAPPTDVVASMHHDFRLEPNTLTSVPTKSGEYYVFPASADYTGCKTYDNGRSRDGAWYDTDTQNIMWPANEEVPPPLHIETPTFERVFDGQDWDIDTRLVFYALCGRLLFEVNTFDGWGVIMVLAGATRAGKSTLIEAVLEALFPDRNKVGVWSSNSEKQFGLMGLVRKFVVVCEEMRGDMRNWDVGQLKAMATGNSTSVARKGIEAWTGPWTAPMLFTTNDDITHPDKSGALAMRMAMFVFAHSIQHQDTRLPQQLRGEYSAFLVKSLRCYRYVCQRYPDRAFSDLAPPSMLKAQQEVAVATSPVRAWLAAQLAAETLETDGTTLAVARNWVQAKHGTPTNFYYAPLRELMGTLRTDLQRDGSPKARVEDLVAALTTSGYYVTVQRMKWIYPVGSGKHFQSRYVLGLRIPHGDDRGNGMNLLRP